LKASLLIAVLLTTGVLLTVGISAQQDPGGPPPAQDPPSRVARLNWTSGAVSFQPAGVDTWVPASLNYPLTTGDHLYTDTDGLAEMHIGPNAIHLNFQSNFGFLNLDDATVQMRFTEGAMEVRLRALADQDVYEVDTPNGAITLLRAGDYRIETDPNRNATMITVNAGDAEVTANGSAFPVHARQTAYFSDGAPPDVRPANPPDDFDRFVGDRNAAEDRQPPPQYVPTSMIGYQDLSSQGTWQDTPQYGPVWAPPVQAGWAPYHNGRWVWVDPWGWTWVDEAPWGFAPFHYGRWALLGARWVWIPGTRAVRPVYAPALVAFVGGPGFGIGIGGGLGSVAWFPLGPQEVYRPAYAVSAVYVRQVNVTNVTNVTTITNVTNVRYVNQTVPGAVTAVPQSGFAASRPVAAIATPVTPQQMASARVLGGAPVVPQRESVLGGAAVGRVAQPAGAVMARQVVTRTAPPPAPVAFAAKQAALAQNGGRPLAPAQVAQIRQQQPAPAAAAPALMNRPPVNRMDSRPPSAVPQPVARPVQQTPAVTQAPAPRPATPVQESRPAPTMQEARPAPAPPARPSTAAPPAQRRADKKQTDRKDEHK